MQIPKPVAEIKKICSMSRRERADSICEICGTNCKFVKQGGYSKRRMSRTAAGTYRQDRTQRFMCKKRRNQGKYATFTYIEAEAIPYSQYHQALLNYLGKDTENEGDSFTANWTAHLEASTIRRLKAIILKAKEKLQIELTQFFLTTKEFIEYCQEWKRDKQIAINQWFFQRTGHTLFGTLSQHRAHYCSRC